MRLPSLRFPVMSKDLQAIATILSLVNPGVCAAMFIHAEQSRAPRAQIVDATKAVLTILVVLLLAAFFGSKILNVFGISLAAFSVAGGSVLAWIGFAMLSGRSSTSTPGPDTGPAPSGPATAALAPLILFAASPGTITGVITISVSHTGLEFPTTAVIAIIVVLAVTWIALVLTTRLKQRENGGGIVRDMVTRYMGLIVIAMGIQFLLTGVKTFMGAG